VRLARQRVHKKGVSDRRGGLREQLVFVDLLGGGTLQGEGDWDVIGDFLGGVGGIDLNEKRGR